jgi:hypothetical protein
MKKVAVVAAVVLFSCSVLFADVSVTDRSSTLRTIANAEALQPVAASATPADRAARHAAAVAADQAKRAAKRARQHAHGSGGTVSALAFHPGKLATGSVGLIDAGGLKYFINTNITFSTSSSASGAASEASYQAPIVASTAANGTTHSTLNDMFDGYNTLCVSLTNALGPCATGDANYAIYNKNGPASVDGTVPPAYAGRQYVFPTQTIGGLHVSRKVFVPTDDRYIRWMNIFTNTTGSPITFTAGTDNNLGSDSNTIIVNSSNGNATAEVTDTWITTFQNFSGSTSSDPRIGHVINGVGAPPLASIHFANGDDNPYWFYSITLAPGQTKIIVNFATGQGTKAAAAAQAANLAQFGPNAEEAMSATELSETVNFIANPNAIPALSTWMLMMLAAVLGAIALVRRT